MTDPIADMLTRIRNASIVRKADVLIPYSKIKLAIAQILQKENYISKVEVLEDGFKSIKVSLKYEGRKPAISNIKRVSKVGRRVYVSKDQIKPVLNGYGISVLSTSKGIMSDLDAKKGNIGGEVICEIY